MLTLITPIKDLAGVGAVMIKRLAGLGVATVGDLLWYFPFRHDDYRAITPIEQARIGEEITVLASVKSIINQRSPKRHIAITKATLIDETGLIGAVWFNQPFLIKILPLGSRWHFHGKVGFDRLAGKVLISPSYELTAGLLAVYHETYGVTSKWLRKTIKPLINAVNQIDDYLPEGFVKKLDLIFLPQALRQIHFPETKNDLAKARQRLGFDEVFLIALRLGQIKRQIAANQAPAMKIDKAALKTLVDNLPFSLTSAQARAAKQIIADLVKPAPMNRLVQGDVGSGKTVVAAIAALVVAQNGYQTAWLAPTEILANQHFRTVSALLGPLNIRVSIMTGATKLGTDAQVVIGTHALLQSHIKFKKLGLVIVDEQHRFGVKQRAAIRFDASEIPHFLSMTATPIPRTLALAYYGDLDISLIDELPANRKPIVTRVIDPENRTKAYEFIRDQIKRSRQVYVITPLIEEKSPQKNQHPQNSQKSLFSEIERKSAVKEYEKLQNQIFPDLRVGLLHGKMKAKDKDEMMQNFKNRKIDILVSTAVVEVGIDVANATVMMIEDADRFGLAQLHQFRGRVGRGEHSSYCFLFASSTGSLSRIKAMEQHSSGFKLAEIDLKLRGPGEIVGVRQSGLPELKIASLLDIILIEKARQAAADIIEEGIEKYPTIAEKLTKFERVNHLE